jgi:hypothetical protein
VNARGDAAASGDEFPAFAQRVGQALEHGPVQVGAGVDVGEADDGATRMRARVADAGAPARLQHQALAARRHAGEQAVEQRFGG